MFPVLHASQVGICRIDIRKIPAFDAFTAALTSAALPSEQRQGGFRLSDADSARPDDEDERTEDEQREDQRAESRDRLDGHRDECAGDPGGRSADDLAQAGVQQLCSITPVMCRRLAPCSAIDLIGGVARPEGTQRAVQTLQVEGVKELIDLLAA